MEPSDAKRLRAENAKLKRIVADQVLDMSTMRNLRELEPLAGSAPALTATTQQETSSFVHPSLRGRVKIGKTHYTIATFQRRFYPATSALQLLTVKICKTYLVSSGILGVGIYSQVYSFNKDHRTCIIQIVEPIALAAGVRRHA